MSDDRRADFANRLRLAQPRLFAYVLSLVRNLDDAEDLFQQTTVVLWRKYDDFDRTRSFLSWACGIARLEAANFLRARGRDRLYFSDELNGLLIEAYDRLPDEGDDRREALAQCVRQLRQRDRELLDACYGEPGGVNAFAARVGRRPQSIHNSLRRLRQALLECVQRRLGQSPNPRYAS